MPPPTMANIANVKVIPGLRVGCILESTEEEIDLNSLPNPTSTPTPTPRRAGSTPSSWATRPPATTCAPPSPTGGWPTRAPSRSEGPRPAPHFAPGFVATPCPLILAVPVALVSGLSRAAGIGVLIKGGGALELLARIRTALSEATGAATGSPVRQPAGVVLDGVLRARCESILMSLATRPAADKDLVARTVQETASFPDLMIWQPSIQNLQSKPWI